MKSFWIYGLMILFTLNFCKKKNEEELFIQTGIDYAKALEYIKNYKTDSAEIILQQFISKKTEEDTPNLFVQSQITLGRIDSDQGKNVEALQHYQAALNTAENQNLKDQIPHIYKNMGVLYVQWKKFDEALHYYNLSEKLATALGYKELIADCQNNKGIIYEQQEDYSKALAAYESALKHYQSENIPDKIAMVYSNLAIVHKLLKDYEQSVKFNLKAIEIFENSGDKWSIAATYNNIGNLYREMGNFNLAQEYGKQSLEIAQEIKAEEIVGMAYETLALTAAESKDYKSAYDYQLKFSNSMNQFINKESTRQLAELNIKYETEKKEKLIAETQLASKQKNIWLILLGTLMLLGLLIFKNYRQKSQHRQQQLTLENQLLQEQTHSKMQEQRLEISRDLHDSLGAQLTFIQSTLDSLEHSSSNLDENIKKKISSLSNFSESSISELKNTLWVLNTNDLRLEDLKNKMLNFIRNASEAKEEIDFQFRFKIEENIEIPSKHAIHIFRAFQEILNNAMKYADASEIKVIIYQNKRALDIQISDNGKGFDINDEKLNSYGLKNIQSRIKLLDAQMNFQSSKEKGTQYQIQIQM